MGTRLIIDKFRLRLQFFGLGPAGGSAGELRIKVGNMEPACCECNHGGTIADTLFLKRLSLTGKLERSHPQPGSGRRMNDSKVRHDSRTPLSCISNDRSDGNRSRPRPTAFRAATTRGSASDPTAAGSVEQPGSFSRRDHPAAKKATGL